MANRLQQILVWSETTPDTIPTSPACYLLRTESFGITASQNSETNNELGAGRGASAKAYGTLNIGGDLGMIWNTDNAPFLFKHGIGIATATANATSDSWVADTVQSVGDLVNHSDGLHTLVARVVTGTFKTHATTEPDLSAYTTSALGRGVRIVDNEVTWIIMPLLKEQSGVRGNCIAPFGVEVQDDDSCGASDPQFTRFTGLHIGTLPISISGTMNANKSSISTTGMSEEDSIIVADEGGAYEKMADKAGFTETEMISDYFLLEDCTFYLDASPASIKTTAFDATINNTVSVEDALNSEKIENIGIVEISGTFNMLMDKALFAEAAGHEVKSAKFVFQKANGCLMEIEFPQFKLEKTFKQYDTDKTTMVSIPFSAFDTSSVYSVQWRTISPISL